MMTRYIAAALLTLASCGQAWPAGTTQPAASQSSAPSSSPYAANVRFIASESVTGSLIGSEYTGPPRPAPRDPQGHPDLTGFWKGMIEKGKPGGNIGKDQPGFKLPLTPAGEAALRKNLTQVVDPESRCIHGGVPRHEASGIPFQILQTAQVVGFVYYLGHRLVPVDGRKHDPDPEPTYFGNAIGRWEGDTFVVDVIGFKDSKDGNLWIDENGNPQSERTHLVERWTRPDYHHLHLALTVDDPVYYRHLFTFDRTWIRGGPGERLNEYACNENNTDLPHLGPGPGAIGPDGNRGSGYMHKPLPDVPPGPEAYGK